MAQHKLEATSLDNCTAINNSPSKKLKHHATHHPAPSPRVHTSSGNESTPKRRRGKRRKENGHRVREREPAVIWSIVKFRAGRREEPFIQPCLVQDPAPPLLGCYFVLCSCSGLPFSLLSPLFSSTPLEPTHHSPPLSSPPLNAASIS